MGELQVLESPRQQASDEIIAWNFNWSGRLEGQTISNCTATVVQLNNGTDESATCLFGTPSVSGEHVTVVVQALTARKRYRVTAHATLSGGTVQDADLLLEVPH